MDGDVFPFDNQTEDFPNVSPLIPSIPNNNNNNPIIVNEDEMFSFDSLWRESSSLCFNEIENNKSSEINDRKIMHRDVERLRRQETSSLHASLRSLLPPEYLKGKRSISEHMDQAVNYIKHLESKIQELRNKRERLRKLRIPTQTMEISEAAAKQGVVTVRLCLLGVEVVISTAFEEGFPLSRVLQILIREGLIIIHCNSTKVNGRLFHTIESEVDNDGGRIDLSELEQKLTSLIAQS